MSWRQLAAKREGQIKNASGPLRCKDRNSQWHRDCLVYRHSNLSNEKSVSNHVKTFRPAARLDCRGLAEDAEGWGWRAGRAGKHRKSAE
ncbi:hypothetical protein GE21DRAFT_6248 [Neurospora crassa]|uniref:Uncharacterized protein n=1 Tax=Neurospora crassa (strain ATCC 24698 / 74-OR23-1A / CBS 708.71 / DSM 1257 / FGSC 987) TaxID=367110 RepID=A7UX61_NEUCR|nr:hypothetical protein NCU10867 [Neurospora crassa OR74A]EDO64981.1 hypothetical protein NCU10867 [Neurospora crassa OR74A]KHE84413.1 hypothetical protein GE21DRAFT_6248 [Neurospora crassa]|eukprot:XP_001728072.1 hypothetical protein NCU10867 [Neurospora crassa OR74A]